MAARKLDVLEAVVAVLAAVFAAPVRAQVAASATVASEYDYRGASLSAGQPALNLSLSYDHRSGLYVGGSAIGEVTSHAGPQMLGEVEYLGYARHWSRGPTVDVGATNFRYTVFTGAPPSGAYYGGTDRVVRTTTDTTQVYAGLLQRDFSVYAYYSPDYFGERMGALYTELNGAVRPGAHWRLFAHLGVLTPVSGHPASGDASEEYDLRAGIAAEIRHVELQLAWTTRRPNVDDLGDYRRARSGVVVSASWFF